jgi:hypothetical protein
MGGAEARQTRGAETIRVIIRLCISLSPSGFVLTTILGIYGLFGGRQRRAI